MELTFPPCYSLPSVAGLARLARGGEMKTNWTIYKKHSQNVGPGAYCGCAICEEVATDLFRAGADAAEIYDAVRRREQVIRRHNRGRISKRDRDRL